MQVEVQFQFAPVPTWEQPSSNCIEEPDVDNTLCIEHQVILSVKIGKSETEHHRHPN